MKEKNIVTVVVTYNRKELLKECINSLKRQTYKNNIILIIDNNSTDGTKSYIKKLIDSNTVYINTGNNLGGAGGFNYGIKEALKYNPSNIWVMDDDCISNKDALQRLIDSANILKDNYSYLSSRVLWTNNKVCDINRQSLDRKLFDSYDLIEKGLLRIKTASFVSCFINVESIYKVGLPIKEFFIWGDDTEYTQRLSDYKPAYYVNNSIVHHKSKECNLPSIAEDTRDISRFYYLYKKLKKDHIKNILKNANNKKIKRIHIILKGSFNGRFFNPRIEYVNKDSE